MGISGEKYAKRESPATDAKLSLIWLWRISCAGDILTPEEWLRYAVEKIKADGRGDLLYLPDDWEE